METDVQISKIGEEAGRPSESGPVRLGYSRVVIARAAASVVGRLVHPDVYRSVGIDPSVGRQAGGGRVALANPHLRATLRWSASKAVDHLAALGLIDGPAKRIWRRAPCVGSRPCIARDDPRPAPVRVVPRDGSLPAHAVPSVHGVTTIAPLERMQFTPGCPAVSAPARHWPSTAWPAAFGCHDSWHVWKYETQLLAMRWMAILS